MKELSEEEALRKAAAYCSQAEHCSSEVSGKLDGWGVSSDGKRRILQRLVAEKYLDESRYCRFFIHDKLMHNKWGRHKIAQALQTKRIPSEISAPLLEEIDEEEYRSVLRGLLESKRRTLDARDGYEMDGKLIRFALGRGFEMDEIRRCADIRETDDWMDA